MKWGNILGLNLRFTFGSSVSMRVIGTQVTFNSGVFIT